MRGIASSYRDFFKHGHAGVPILSGDFCERIDDSHLVFIFHGWIKRKRNAAIEVVLSHGKISGTIAPAIAIVGMEMERDEVHGDADAALLELLNHAVAVNRKFAPTDANHVEVPGVLHIGP